jgi:hypothetical protein
LINFPVALAVAIASANNRQLIYYSAICPFQKPTTAGEFDALLRDIVESAEAGANKSFRAIQKTPTIIESLCYVKDSKDVTEKVCCCTSTPRRLSTCLGPAQLLVGSNSSSSRREALIDLQHRRAFLCKNFQLTF